VDGCRGGEGCLDPLHSVDLLLFGLGLRGLGGLGTETLHKALELGDLAADQGFGYLQAPGGLGKTAAVDDTDKGLKQIPAFHC